MFFTSCVTLKPFLIGPRNVSGLLEPTLKQQSGIKKILAWPGMAIHSVNHFFVNIISVWKKKKKKKKLV